VATELRQLGTKMLAKFSNQMDARIVKSTVDRAMAAHTNLGLKGDEEHRQLLREAVTSYVEHLVQHGEQDVDKLVARALKHLRSLDPAAP
jgi:phosphosulfolactate synthase (CoM biosynthesis protein A)